MRGRVRMAASTDGRSWRVLGAETDTGPDGTVTFVIRPKRATYLRLSTRVAAGSGWSVTTRDPVVHLRVGRAATTLTMVGAKRGAALISGRLLIARNSQPVAGRSVALQYRAVGSTTWRRIRSFTTSSSGRVSSTLRGSRAGYYRWHYGGSAADLPDVSPATSAR